MILLQNYCFKNIAKKIDFFLLYKLITILCNKIMIIELFKNFYQYLMVKFFPDYYEYKVIERVNSSGSFIEYSGTDQ